MKQTFVLLFAILFGSFSQAAPTAPASTTTDGDTPIYLASATTDGHIHVCPIHHPVIQFRNTMKITEPQLQEWKAKYGDVYEISVPKEEGSEGSYTGYFHKPNRASIANASRFMQDNPFKANEILFNSALIECDDAMKSDDAVYISACSKVGELLQIREASLKKL